MAQLGTQPEWLLLPLGAVVVLLWAWRRDEQTLYLARLPAWLDATNGVTFRSELYLILCTRSSWLRVLHVVPDHTVYTRAQLLLVLLNSLTLMAAATIIFVDQQQCSAEVSRCHGLLYLLTSLTHSLTHSLILRNYLL